jgi:hypothetical protein
VPAISEVAPGPDFEPGAGAGNFFSAICRPMPQKEWRLSPLRTISMELIEFD